jgi:hypothetical protein
MTTAGMSQQTTGIKIQGKNDAAYEPVITKFPILYNFRKNFSDSTVN